MNEKAANQELDLTNIGVVIAAYERLNHTVSCLQSLISAGIDASQIVVVDGGSMTETVAALRSQFSDVQIVDGLGNLWWAEGMNVGLQQLLSGPHETILFLNQDCVIERDALLALTSAQKTYPEAGVFVSVVLDINCPDYVLDGGKKWKRHNIYPGVWVLESIYPDATPYSKLPSVPYPVEIFTGRGVLVRRDVLEQVGIFDARHFPQRGSDDDLSVRVYEAGIKTLVVPNSKIYTGADDCGADRRPKNFWKHLYWTLFHPIGGQGLAVHFWFVLKHCSLSSALPTYIYRIANSVRLAWRQSLQG